jgi:hypothetical protein
MGDGAVELIGMLEIRDETTLVTEDDLSPEATVVVSVVWRVVIGTDKYLVLDRLVVLSVTNVPDALILPTLRVDCIVEGETTSPKAVESGALATVVFNTNKTLSSALRARLLILMAISSVT